MDHHGDNMKTKAIAHWFGSNRMLAEHVGHSLAGCRWVGVPFAGGMSELVAIKARTIVVNDLHRHVINLARVVKDHGLRRQLKRELDDTLFHDEELSDAQRLCRHVEPIEGSQPNVALAVAYFKAVWMNRANKAGIDDEFNGKLCVRWNASGGDSAIRFRSAVKSLSAWREIMRRCTFTCRDAFEWLPEVKDEHGHGLYCDPPFPVAGRRYRHNAGKTDADETAWHKRLRDALGLFTKTLVVCRFYDHPLIRELYGDWTWKELKGRDQANNAKPEVLVTNRPQQTLFPTE
jgi:site-specific DNA-adenine methylase